MVVWVGWITFLEEWLPHGLLEFARDCLPPHIADCMVPVISMTASLPSCNSSVVIPSGPGLSWAFVTAA